MAHSLWENAVGIITIEPTQEGNSSPTIENIVPYLLLGNQDLK